MLNIDKRLVDLQHMLGILQRDERFRDRASAYAQRLSDWHMRAFFSMEPVIAEAKAGPDRVIPTFDEALYEEYHELDTEALLFVREAAQIIQTESDDQ